jgi:hypothetical protein
MAPDSDPVPGPVNDPMMPVAWTNMFTTDTGKQARVFVSTLGAADDLENEGVRRLFVNATYWATGLEAQISPKADVAFIGTYNPHSMMSEVYTAGVKPSDLAIDKRSKQ